MTKASTTAALEVRDLSHAYGGVKAVDDVSFAVAPGEILALVGPNGAGKTSVLNLVSGAYRPRQGRVLLEGHEVQGVGMRKLRRMGMARTFQNSRLIETLTIAENVTLPLADLHGLSAGRKAAGERLRAFGLEALRDQRPSEISAGARKLVELCRACVTDPKVLLLDEVFSGVSEKELDRYLEVIEGLARGRVAIVVVEHLMRVVRRVAGRTVVLNSGAVIASGPTEQVLSDRRVIEAYLGESPE